MRDLPLEDDFNDILAKALRGRKLSRDEVAAQAGLSTAALKALLDGEFAEEGLRRVARVLDLAEEPLVAIGQRSWYPEPISPFEGLAGFTTPYGEMTVNAFLAWDPASKRAAAFDTGADSTPMRAFAREHGLVIERVLLTHVHGDHIHDLANLLAETGAKAYISALEPIAAAETLQPGSQLSLGALAIECRHTSGHTHGGLTYVVRGLAHPVAVVGDAMFAGSIGGGMVSYADALKHNREQILTLPDDTVICPGHGPFCTVAENKRHNPFFPEFSRG